MKLEVWKEHMGARICAIGRHLAQGGYVAANDGNISVRCPDGHILITPTGVWKGEMTPDILLELDPQGAVVRQGPLGPSSETPMHLALYAAHPQIGGVVHTHSPHALCMAAQREDLICDRTADGAIWLGRVPVLPYLPLGTDALAQDVAQSARQGARSALLACHGAVTWGSTLDRAWFRTQVLEGYCHQVWLQRVFGGDGSRLSGEELRDLEGRYR